MNRTFIQNGCMKGGKVLDGKPEKRRKGDSWIKCERL